ncbi:MAG: double-strand break repair helicase AddA, partial [Pseudomonadota bacterium]
MTEQAVIPPDSPAFQQALRAQAEAASPGQSAWVEANAGSGKTKVLIDRVARLLLRRENGQPGASPDSILCITYTKAAANEMLARLFSRLGEWSIASDEDLRLRLSRLEGRDQSAYRLEDLKDARALFARALETPGGLRIETIHAFCARILRRFPLEAGVSPGFTEIEDSEAEAIWQGVLSATLEKAALDAPDAIKTLADATGGSGVGAALEALRSKRTALLQFARKIGALGDDEDLWQTALTADIRNACAAPDIGYAEALQRAMLDALPVDEIKRAIAELEAVKRGKADDTLLTALYAVLDTDDPGKRYQLYLSALAGRKTDWPSRSNPFTKAVPEDGTVVDLFARSAKDAAPEGREITRIKALQAELLTIATAERTEALLALGLPMVRAYQDAKARRAALDFEDLIEATRTLLTEKVSADWVLYKLDGGLTHVLLDEAQDTSPSQWSLINALVSEFQAGQGVEGRHEPRTQFVVGDPKQSIYSFQGADETRFREEKEAFMAREQRLADAQERAIKTPEMAMSFRSTPQVLGFVDAVRARVPLSEAATDLAPPSDADLIPHQPRRANQAGRVELWPLVMPAESPDPDDPWTAPVDHMPENAPRRRLARDIARQIRAMLSAGETIWSEAPDRTWHRRALRPEDILILVRTRNDLFEALIDSLKQEGLPVAGADRLRLLDNLGVQDCLNILRFILQPDDDLVFAEIVRGPFGGIVDDNEGLFVLADQRQQGETLFATLTRLVKGSGAPLNPAFSPLYGFLAACLERRGQSAFDVLQWCLHHRFDDGLSGWDKLIQRLGQPVRDPVQALVMAALGRDMTDAMSLQVFLDETERQNAEIKRELGEPEGAIRVMTVHGAKGLQAPLVILPDTTSATKATRESVFFTEDGTPLYSPAARLDCRATTDLRGAANVAGERESRRLLYVALTRAADRLIIAGAGQRRLKGGYAKTAWYRWCRAAMADLMGEALDDDETVLEAPLVFGPEPVRLPPASAATEEAAVAPAWLYRPVSKPRPPLRIAAPSRLSEDRAPVLSPFGPARAAALHRGRLIHALLQVLPALPPEERGQSAAAFLARAPDLSDKAREEILTTTLKTLEAPDFKAIFAPGGRSEAAIVGTLPKGQMVNGRVDRLVITPEKIMIIDYKT